jgi:hypothetical protein
MMRRVALAMLTGSLAIALTGCRATPDAPLSTAAAAGDAAEVRALLAAGAAVDAADARGMTPLIWASRRGRLDAMRALIAAGADVNRADAAGHRWTVLLHAIHTNQPEAVHALLQAGANPNRRSPGVTPLIMAAGYGYTTMVRDLLSHGADPYASRSDGMTALTAAVGGAADIDRFTVASCQTSTVQALLERAPALSIDSDTFAERWALRFARLGGCAEVLQLLRDRQAGRR